MNTNGTGPLVDWFTRLRSWLWVCMANSEIRLSSIGLSRLTPAQLTLNSKRRLIRTPDFELATEFVQLFVQQILGDFCLFTKGDHMLEPNLTVGIDKAKDGGDITTGPAKFRCVFDF